MFEIRKTSAFGPISQRCQTSSLSVYGTVLVWLKENQSRSFPKDYSPKSKDNTLEVVNASRDLLHTRWFLTSQR